MKNAVRQLATWQPNAREAAALISHLQPAADYLGHPSKWGYETPLANLSVELHALIHDLGRIAVSEVAADTKFDDEELPPVIGERYRRGLDDSLRRPDREEDGNGK